MVPYERVESIARIHCLARAVAARTLFSRAAMAYFAINQSGSKEK